MTSPENIRTVDFDAFRAEQEKRPVHLKIDGVKYDLPPDLPASIAIGIIRLRAEKGEDAEIPEEMVDQFGKDVFGDQWDELLHRHRITVPEMPVLLQKVLEVYTGEAPKAESPTSAKKGSSSAS